MSITIKKNFTITNLNDWFIVAPPKGKEKQWKDGYSAKELAKFVTAYKEKFNELIKSIVTESFGSKISASFCGEPEAETKLPPKGSRGPRNHDLLLYNKDLVIGIEAKVNEPFGNRSILEEYEDAQKNNRQHMINRIDWLKRTILPAPQKEEANHLKYQLFTATAGTLLEAYRRKVKKCIVLVLSFEYDNQKSNDDNNNAFKKFVEIVCGTENNSRDFSVLDDESKESRSITCKFVKKEIVISKTE